MKDCIGGGGGVGGYVKYMCVQADSHAITRTFWKFLSNKGCLHLGTFAVGRNVCTI